MINIVKELENLVNKTVDPALFPVKKGNTICIGDYAVKTVNHSYAVFLKGKELDRFQTKTAAVAFARLKTKNSQESAEIHRLDRLISKKITDCVFYKNALERGTKDRQSTVSIQLEDSRMHIKDARDKLEQFIFRRAKYT